VDIMDITAITAVNIGEINFYVELKNTL